MASRAGMFTPLDSSGNGMSYQDGRYAMAAIMGTTQRCIAGGGFTQSGSNMQFTLLPSAFVLADLDLAGAVTVTPFDTWTFTLAAGPSSGSRIDSVIVRQQTPGSSLNETSPYGAVSTVQGNPSTGTPSAPAIPAGWYEYARITVPTNASTASQCAYQIMYPAFSASPPLVAPSLASLQTITSLSYTGQRGFVGSSEYRWDGGNWRPWVADEVGYTMGSGFNPNNTGIHTTKHGRIVTLQFNVSGPNNTFSGSTALFTLNDTQWAPATSVDFPCEIRDNGGGVNGTAWLYLGPDGALRYSNHNQFGSATLASTCPANELLIGSVSYRSTN